MAHDDLPTFIVIGAMKAGTTSLARYLGEHPDVFVCRPKEPQFFIERGTWDRGVAWYRDLFADGRAATARGEASTDYSKLPAHAGVAERMAGVVPDARIVYLVRDPIERMLSQYVHEVGHMGLRQSAADAIHDDPRYVDLSRYAYQIAPYRERFGDDRVLIVASDALKSDRIATLDAVLRFIEVDPIAAQLDLRSELNTAGSQRARARQRNRVAEIGATALRRSGLRSMVPARLRRQGYQAVTRAVVGDENVTIPDELRHDVLQRLHDDIAELEALAPGVTASWSKEP
jgi:hypothetical protein